MSNEMQLYNPNAEAPQAFMTLAINTPEDKKKLFNATTNPDEALSDHINEVIPIKDVYMELVELVDQRTGEKGKQVRTILFDTKGKSFACVSSGVYNSLVRAFNIFGAPTWPDGLKFKVVQIRKDKNAILSLQLAE